MNKKELYTINKNIEKLKRKESTNFLDPKELKNITNKLPKNQYQIYYPYQDCDKVILYNTTLPKIKLIEIITDTPLTHREILGSLFGLNISNDTFGDIIIIDNKYYFLIIDSIYDLIKNNLFFIGNKKIKLKEENINILNNYQRKYKDINLIVSSLRIDTVIARLIGTNRYNIKNKIKNKEIIINYNILTNNSYILKENDIFSIRKHGKYKFIKIINTTKKNNYIIEIKQYI